MTKFVLLRAQKLNDSQFKPQFYVGVEGSYSSPGYNFKKDLDPNYAVYAKVSVLFLNGENGEARSVFLPFVSEWRKII